LWRCLFLLDYDEEEVYEAAEVILFNSHADSSLRSEKIFMT